MSKPYSGDINDLIEADEIEKGRGPDKQQRHRRGEGPAQEEPQRPQGGMIISEADKAWKKKHDAEEAAAKTAKNKEAASGKGRGLNESERSKEYDKIKERDSKPTIGERADAAYKKNQMKARNHESGMKARASDYLKHNNTPADKGMQKSYEPELIYKAHSLYVADINDLIEDDIEKGRGPDKQQRKSRDSGPSIEEHRINGNLEAAHKLEAEGKAKSKAALADKLSRMTPAQKDAMIKENDKKIKG